MKKLNAICLFIFCFLISNSELFGQWRFGPQVGLNYSTTTDAYDSKFGTNFGGVVQYEFDLSFSLYQRVLYSNKGAIRRFDFGGNLGELDFKYNYSYLELPLALNYDLTYEVDQPVALFAGPYLGILLRNKAELLDYVPGLTYQSDQTKYTNKIDYGFWGGISFLWSERFSWSLFGSVGLAGGLKNAKSENEDFSHLVLGTNLCYMFGDL